MGEGAVIDGNRLAGGLTADGVAKWCAHGLGLFGGCLSTMFVYLGTASLA